MSISMSLLSYFQIIKKSQINKLEFSLKMSLNSKEEEAEKVCYYQIEKSSLRNESMKSEIDLDEGQKDI